MNQYLKKLFFAIVFGALCAGAIAQSNPSSQERNKQLAKCGDWTMIMANSFKDSGKTNDYEMAKADAFTFFNYLTDKVFNGDSQKTVELVASIRPDNQKMLARENMKEVEAFSKKCALMRIGLK